MVVGGHAGIFLLDWQERYINDMYVVGFEELDAINKSLRERLDSSASVIDKQGRVVIDLQEEKRLLIDKNRDLLGADAVSQKEITDLQRQGKWSKFERNILIVACAALILTSIK